MFSSIDVELHNPVARLVFIGLCVSQDRIPRAGRQNFRNNWFSIGSASGLREALRRDIWCFRIWGVHNVYLMTNGTNFNPTSLFISKYYSRTHRQITSGLGISSIRGQICINSTVAAILAADICYTVNPNRNPLFWKLQTPLQLVCSIQTRGTSVLAKKNDLHQIPTKHHTSLTVFSVLSVFSLVICAGLAAGGTNSQLIGSCLHQGIVIPSILALSILMIRLLL